MLTSSGWHGAANDQRTEGPALRRRRIITGFPGHGGPVARGRVPASAVQDQVQMFWLAFLAVKLGDGCGFGAAPLVNIGAELADFEDTMAVLQSLDVLVTVDTSVGHVAGAMGRKALILLARTPDWRWLLNRTDTPWYRSVRLLRQTATGAWGNAMAEAAALAVASSA